MRLALCLFFTTSQTSTANAAGTECSFALLDLQRDASQDSIVQLDRNGSLAMNDPDKDRVVSFSREPSNQFISYRAGVTGHQPGTELPATDEVRLRVNRDQSRTLTLSLDYEPRAIVNRRELMQTRFGSKPEERQQIFGQVLTQRQAELRGQGADCRVQQVTETLTSTLDKDQKSVRVLYDDTLCGRLEALEDLHKVTIKQCSDLMARLGEFILERQSTPKSKALGSVGTADSKTTEQPSQKLLAAANLLRACPLHRTPEGNDESSEESTDDLFDETLCAKLGMFQSRHRINPRDCANQMEKASELIEQRDTQLKREGRELWIKMSPVLTLTSPFSILINAGEVLRTCQGYDAPEPSTKPDLKDKTRPQGKSAS